MDSIRILAVDDDWTDLEIIKRSLKDKISIKGKSFDITTCNSGKACMDQLAMNKYDLILLDCIMPEIDGYQVCRNVISQIPDMPVIMITGMKDNTSLKKAFESGAVDYITKPIVQIELLMRINNILKLKDSELEAKSLYTNVLKDLDFASIVQRCMIPDWCNVEENIIFSLLYRPCEKVSGDLFDIIKITDKKYCVYIGDISGHGVQAALLMSAFQSVLKMYIHENFSDLKINVILNKLNYLMSEKFTNVNYMTITIGIIDLDKNEFEYLVAGHPPIIAYDTRANTASVIEDKGSLPVGMVKSLDYTIEDINRIPISKDTIFFMLTDGVFESNNQENQQLGTDGFLEVITHAGTTDCVLTIQENIFDIIEKCGYRFDDDVTLLLFQVLDKDEQLFYKIQPKLEYVELLIKSIARTLTTSVSEEVIGKLEFIMAEILNNIIVHGYKKNIYSPAIAIRIYLEKDKLVFNSWDHAPAWKLPPPPEPEKESSIVDAESFQTSGRGINIVYSLSTDFSLERFGNINETTVKIKL